MIATGINFHSHLQQQMLNLQFATVIQKLYVSAAFDFVLQKTSDFVHHLPHQP